MRIKLLFLVILFVTNCYGDDIKFSQEEIIYGRKDGMALTMVKLTPEKLNGKAIMNIVSGNFISNMDRLPRYIKNSMIYVERGYTVFVVVHGSQPKYTIPEAFSDVRRAIRFVRFNSSKFKLDANKIGITGASAGGNLALLAALSDDNLEIKKVDSVDEVSSRVRAVVSFFPPTDFINYGKDNPDKKINDDLLRFSNVAAAFDFKIWDNKKKVFVSITDTSERIKIANEISPVNYVSSDDPPVLLIHGDKDIVVPIQQSTLLLEKLKAANVITDLIVRDGKGHGWLDNESDLKSSADWFDKYL